MLQGIKVLDLTRLLPGPLCTVLLADLGANVIKLEEPKRGDYIRETPPFIHGVGATHLQVNRNKRSIAIDLKAQRGKEVFKRLAQTADVLIEGFRPGVMDSLGLGYSDLAKENPRLVYASLSGFGSSGPYKDVPGHDLNYMGIGGVLAALFDQETPRVPGLLIADITSGLLVAVGIVSALLGRSLSGRGQNIEVSILDAVSTWLTGNIADLNPGAEGTSLLAGLPNYNLYKSGDGQLLAVGALEEKFWRQLCRRFLQIGVVDEPTCEFLLSPEAKKERSREAYELVAQVFASKSRVEWLNLLQDADVCVTPVHPVAGILEDEHIKGSGVIFQGCDNDGNVVNLLKTPLRINGSLPEVGLPAPLRGQHSVSILREYGLAEGEITDLLEAGIIEQAAAQEELCYGRT